jgi:hypothetical protein
LATSSPERGAGRKSNSTTLRRFGAADALFLAAAAGGAAALRLLPVTVWLGALGTAR